MAISEVTRRAIIDELILGPFRWSGSLEEPDFLGRIYPMNDLPSYDGRFSTAYRDVHKHRVDNDDWDDNWVFTDDRFKLMNGPDEVFLKFLAETIHPVVRPNLEHVAALLETYNKKLRADGYELHRASEISGRAVYSARQITPLPDVPQVLAQLQEAARVDATYLSQQLTRMEAAVVADPELAIGTAKELIETISKTILADHGVPFAKAEKLPKLVREAIRVLDFGGDKSDLVPGAAEAIRKLLMSVAMIGDGVAELRNLYGTGHGRPGGSLAIDAVYVRLVVGAASTLAVFLLEAHQQA